MTYVKTSTWCLFKLKYKDHDFSAGSVFLKIVYFYVFLITYLYLINKQNSHVLSVENITQIYLLHIYIHIYNMIIYNTTIYNYINDIYRTHYINYIYIYYLLFQCDWISVNSKFFLSHFDCVSCSIVSYSFVTP